MNNPLKATPKLSETPVDKALDLLNQIILGKSTQIKLSVCCLFAQGHLLIEDLPGVGKTTLALAIAKVFGLDFQRIQFTSDILPADLIGVSIYDTQQQKFEFHKGPLFAQCVLADEVNRTTPKSQSALLEAMEEHQISVDGDTFILPQPFFVIGTQNPTDQSGTYPLPESQLDRFMMKLELGYPDSKSEIKLYQGNNSRKTIKQTEQLLQSEAIIQIQNAVEKVHTSDALLAYIHRLVEATRGPNLFSYGLSPRAGLAIVKASKSWALIHQRDFVEPDDVKAVFASVAAHRLIPFEETSKSANSVLSHLLDTIAIP